MKYNLVQVGLGEILERAVEFRGFLREEYPFLCKCYTMLEQQIAVHPSPRRLYSANYAKPTRPNNWPVSTIWVSWRRKWLVWCSLARQSQSSTY